MTEQGTHNDHVDRNGNCDLCGSTHALPTARIHVARPRKLFAIAVVLVALGCSAFGTLLSRVDTAREAAAIANAEAQRAYAHTAVLRVELEHAVRKLQARPDFTTQLEACRVRTDHLRSTLEVLIMDGVGWVDRVALPNPPPGWAKWPEKGHVRSAPWIAKGARR